MKKWAAKNSYLYRRKEEICRLSPRAPKCMKYWNNILPSFLGVVIFCKYALLFNLSATTNNYFTTYGGGINSWFY
jgi:hypothetical protein